MALTKVKAGNILLTTPGASSNDVTPATTAYVTTALANLADSAPSTLDTLNELAAALGDDANFSTTVTNSIAAKLPLAGGTLTGNLLIGTTDAGYPAYGDELTIGSASGNNGMTIRSGTSNYGTFYFSDATGNGAGTYAGKLQYNHSDNSMRLATNSLDRLTIDSSGNVGIGNTNPSGMHANANKLVVGTGSGDQGMSVFAGTSVGRYAFARAVGNNTDAYDGGMAYDGSRNLTFHTNANATRMTIDGAGRVGIGVTPVAHYTGYRALDIGTAMSLFSNSGSTNVATMTNNGYLNSGASQWTYKVTDEATMYSQVHGDHRFSTAASGSAGAAITWSESMRLDSSGNLMIGGTNPAPVSNNVAGISLRAVNGEIQASVNGAPALYLNRLNNDGALAYFRKDGTTCGSIATKSGSNGGNNTIVVACQNTGLRFDDPNDAIYPTDDAGILVNNTIDLGQSGAAFNEFYTSKIYLNVAGANNGAPEAMNVYCAGGGGGYGINIKCIGTGGGTMLRFNTAGNIVGQIYTSSSATTYATSSDYRLKENVDYTWDATTRLKQLKPARFNFIVDDTNTLVDGFLAHEVQGIVPEAIKGEKDGDEMQCIDHSKLVPLLTKAIQEQQTLIESLTARIATLEE